MGNMMLRDQEVRASVSVAGAPSIHAAAHAEGYSCYNDLALIEREGSVALRLPGLQEV